MFVKHSNIWSTQAVKGNIKKTNEESRKIKSYNFN